MIDWKGKNIIDGTSQEDRHSPALEPGYFNVDELRFEQLLAMGGEFASVINFFNLNNEVNGHWGEMFNADEAVIMAMIFSIDITRLESDFLKISSDSSEKRVDLILSLAKTINFWFIKLNACQHQSGDALAQKIATIIKEKLVVELHKVGDIFCNIEKHPYDFSGFDSVWTQQESRLPLPKLILSESDNSAHIKQHLRSGFYIFLNSISYLKTLIHPFLQESLGSQQHNPAIGLFIVFLKLYEKAQQKLNTFTQRHLDFYYKQILKVKNKAAVPESVYLLFETQAGTETALIEKGTEFSAGKDESLNEIIYSADDNLVVTDAKVKSLATLYLQHDKLISPESELGYVTRIKSATPQLPKPDTDEGIALPLFGAEKPGMGTTAHASIGFSVASPLLLLKEGVRKIEMAIELEPMVKTDINTMVSKLLDSKTEKQFTQQFGHLFAQHLLTYQGCLTPEYKNQIIAKSKQLTNRVEEIDSLLREDWQGLFYKLFKKIFSIRLTTENGWLDIDNYIVMPYSENGEHGLKISLSLGSKAEPITAYMTDVHGSKLETELPVFQCHINPQSYFYPYSIFQYFVISTLQINVDVKGIKNILAYNQHGQLDPSQPFQPFGPLPTNNSYFIFGNYELAKKPLVDLKVNFEWGELPHHLGGFSEYYRGYETQYENGLFKGELTVLSDDNWQPTVVKANFSLFDANECNKLSAKKTIIVNILDYSKPIDVGFSEEAFQYNLQARNGFFRLSLIEPASAFGHAEYPELLTKVLSANANLKTTTPTPNPPYTPSLNQISLDYKASSKLNLAERGEQQYDLSEKIILMHPFGVEMVYPALDKPGFLLPQYAHEGNLFIGITAKELSGFLTLFFHLSEELEQETNTVNSSIDWFYLSSNTWKMMPAKRVLSDTTNGFLSSGIVTLNIPKDISSDNSLMPSGYFWLRVSATQNAGSFAQVYSVNTHAVKVTIDSQKNVWSQTSEVLETSEVFREIKWSSITSIPGIGKISSAAKPFGGMAKESDIELKKRVSERLRHKNRASVPWDYERLILEQFPELYKVKCFSGISSVENAIKPGQVLIVVVPKVQSLKDKICTRVMINSKQLSQIKAYVKNISSPFVNIEVRNPVYEQVQIRCQVKFIEGISEGVNINRLNQAVYDYICPWKNKGYKAKFGWRIRQKDIESYIFNLSYVEFVTDFSMLHITVDSHGNYRLFDTATENNNEAVIQPRYPWSLAIPAKKHFIETMETTKFIKAEITGINELEIGNTFIISGNREYGKEK